MFFFNISNPPPQKNANSFSHCIKWNNITMTIQCKYLNYFGLFGANCSKAIKFGPDVDKALLDRLAPP